MPLRPQLHLLPGDRQYPPLRQDHREQREKTFSQALHLRITKILNAIFPEQKVDTTTLQYDPEANSYRWTDKTAARNTTCAICLGRFSMGDMIVSSVCDHAFHRDCVLGWVQVQDECPMCRQNMWDLKTYKMLEKEISSLERRGEFKVDELLQDV